MKKTGKKIMIGSIVVGLIVLTICIIFFKNKQWDSVELYYRTLENKIELTQKQEKELADLIWSHEFQVKESGIADEENEIKYGGTMIWAIFNKESEQHSWQLTEQYIAYSVFENGEVVETKVFNVDKDLLADIMSIWM